MIHILLADDQPLVLSGLTTILSTQPDFTVVATASSGAQAIVELTRSPQPIDIAVLDIRMPHQDGIETLTKVRQLSPSTKVIMLTTFNVGDYVERALLSGAHGFLLKDADPTVLINAIRSVAQGESVLSTEVTNHVIHQWRESMRQLPPTIPPEQKQGLGLLTPREVEVFHLVGTGATNTEIAKQLFIAETTVKTHISSLLAKLHCRDRVALAILAQHL